MFSIVYAIPCGGRREFSFKSAEQMADHIQHNRPGLFAGVPQVDDKYDNAMATLRLRPYHIPEQKK